MIKKGITVFIVQLILIFMLISAANAEIVTVYQSVDPIDIYTRSGTSTTLVFPAQIEEAIVGSPSAFSVQKNSKQDKLIVSALKPGVWTNLTVFDKNNKRFVFKLIEDSGDNYYDLVEVKPKENMPYSTIVKIINDERYDIDPSIKKLINMYEVDQFIVENDNLEIEMKRCAKIINTDETVYWIRLHNITNGKISVNRLGLKERKLKSIIAESINIDSESFEDFFLIAQGRGLDRILTLEMRINGEFKNIVLEDIPFVERNFKVYEINNF